MKSIEIQRQEHDKWIHHAFYDDPQLALSEAERLVESNRYPGIRVIEDHFTDGSDVSKSKYLFVSHDKPNTDFKPSATAGAPAPRKTTSKVHKRQPGRTRPTRKEPAKAGPFKMIVLLTAIAIGGAGALIAMRIALGD
jgi:hypothetical protein